MTTFALVLLAATSDPGSAAEAWRAALAEYRHRARRGRHRRPASSGFFRSARKTGDPGVNRFFSVRCVLWFFRKEGR